MRPPHEGLAIELDSYKHHGTRWPFEDDRTRWRRLTTNDWVVLPITDRSMNTPDEVLDSIRAAIGHRLPPGVLG